MTHPRPSSDRRALRRLMPIAGRASDTNGMLSKRTSGNGAPLSFNAHNAFAVRFPRLLGFDRFSGFYRLNGLDRLDRADYVDWLDR
jgi:hypothetical protein